MTSTIKYSIVLLFVLCTAAFAQQGKTYPPGSVPKVTVATLPATHSSDRLYEVTDSADGTCTTGGGSTSVLCRWDGSAYTAVGSGGGGGGGVSSVAASGGTETTSGSAITSTGTIRGVQLNNAQTGTTYAIVDGDRAKYVSFSNASSVAVSIAQAGASGSFLTGWYVDVKNIGAGTVTITPATSTIDGSPTLVLATGQSARINSNGSNYLTSRKDGGAIQATALGLGVAPPSEGVSAIITGGTGDGITVKNTATNGQGKVSTINAGNQVLNVTSNGSTMSSSGLTDQASSGVLFDTHTNGLRFVTSSYLLFGTGGFGNSNERWRIDSSGNLITGTDNSWDIGASGATRPRDFFLGRNALIGGSLGITGAQTNSNTITQTSNSATAFESGPNGGTNPVFRVSNSTASQADGISVSGDAAGSGTRITALSSGSNSPIRLSPKGTAGVDFNDSSGTPRIRLNSEATFLILGNNIGLGFSTSNTNPTTANIDSYLYRGGVATLRQGQADAASPVAQSLTVQSVLDGTTNTAGAAWTFKGSAGTGTGVGGSLIFQVAPAGSTGTTQNALATALTIDSTLTSTFGGPIVAGPSGGVGGTVTLPEGTAASGVAGKGVFYADSTAHRVLLSANNGAFSNVVTAASTDTLTNKTLNGNTATNLVSGSGTLNLNTSGTATVPNATDTLVGKATTDTLTNKSFDAEGTGNVLTTVQKTWFAAAGCNNATASSFWDLGTSLAPTPTCKNSSSGAAQNASLDFPDSDGMFFGQVTQMLGSDFTGTVDAKIRWLAAATTGDVIWNVSTICVADAEVDNPAFNTVSTVTDTAKGTTLQSNDATITSVTITGCAAGKLMHLKISRDRTTSGDTIAGVVSFLGLELTTRRAQ